MKCLFKVCLVSFLAGGLVVSGMGQSTFTSVPPGDGASSEQKLEPLSPVAREIIQLSNAGVEEKVVFTYIQNSTKSFNLNADQIAYLKSNEVSDAVIAAMLEHDKDVKAEEPAPAVTPAPPAEPQPDVDEAPVAEPPVFNQLNGSAPIVNQQNPPSEADVIYFRDSLAPYGSWRYIDNYGWGWQPYTAARYPDWAPYSDGGHWLYSDQGWYWNSDYSWGWAPFHYGRWWRDPRLGWTWFPGRTWAPSWVTWRYSDPYCGWAPLPPGRFYNGGFGGGFGFGLSSDFYTFVTFGNFFNRDLRHHRLRRDRVNQFYGRTTVVNNFAQSSRNTVLNRGLDPQRVATATGQRITPVQVQTLPDGNSTLRPDRVVKFGSIPTVFRPQLSTLAGSGIAQSDNNGTLRTPRLATTGSSVATTFALAQQQPHAIPPATTGNTPAVTTGAPLVGNPITKSVSPAVTRTLPPLARATPAARTTLSAPRFTTGAFPTTAPTVNRENESTAGLPFRSVPSVATTFPLVNGAASIAPALQAPTTIQNQNRVAPPVVPQASSLNVPRSIQSFAPAQPAVVPRVGSPGIIQQRSTPSFNSGAFNARAPQMAAPQPTLRVPAFGGGGGGAIRGGGGSVGGPSSSRDSRSPGFGRW